MKSTLVLLASSFFSLAVHAATYRCAGSEGTTMNLSVRSDRSTIAMTADDGETFRCASLTPRSPSPKHSVVQGDYSNCTCVNGFCAGGVGNVCEEAMAAGLLHDGGSLLYAVTGVGRRPGQKK